MNSTIDKLKNTSHAIEIHPGAEADIPELNKLLKAHPDYIKGLKFTVAEKVGINSSQFFYDHPDSYTLQEENVAKRVVSEVKNSFMVNK